MTTQNATVIVRDRDAIRYLEEVDDWEATKLLAGVSSDPRSFRELGLAWQRYHREEQLEDLPWGEFTASAPTFTGVWILIDLINLRLRANDEDAIPVEAGGYMREEGEWTVENPVVWINYPPGWQRVISTDAEPQILPADVPSEPLNFRGVLFGRAMAEDFAARMAKIALSESLPSEHYRCNDLRGSLEPGDVRRDFANRWHAVTVRVHADWLMTPRDDLDGEMPRVFLHRGRDWVDREIENRKREWTVLRRPPRALDRDVYTSAHGPMGLQEVVVYFEFCREVIQAGWKMLCEAPEIREDTARWAAQMYAHARNWLEQGEIDEDPTPPLEIIESSRRHMPCLADGTHLDCDCPMCEMMASQPEMFSPTFEAFDGHHLELDDEFAFSLWESREEWQEEQASFR